jgi:DNA-binding MarR family transcriptional regulator
MNLSELDKQLLASQQYKERSWVKLISVIKRQLDSWASAEVARQGYDDFKLGHMPLLMNISPEGITNTELAKKARVTKQAMSKVVNELVDLEYIETIDHDTDKRSSVIRLTKKGKLLVVTARNCMLTLEAEYEQQFGKQEFEKTKDMLLKVMQYNEAHLNQE